MTFEQWWAEVQKAENNSLIKFNDKQIAAGAWNRAISEIMIIRKDVNWDDKENNVTKLFAKISQ